MARDPAQTAVDLLAVYQVLDAHIQEKAPDVGNLNRLVQMYQQASRLGMDCYTLARADGLDHDGAITFLQASVSAYLSTIKPSSET